MLLYVVLMLCRVIFTLYNSSIFGSIEWNEIGKLIYGGLRFDTISICYAFGLWIVLSLLPLHLREKRWYSKTLFWYYAIVGAFCVAVNIADAVYFRYTEKRFTPSLLRNMKYAKIHTKGMVIHHARYQKQLASLRRFP